MVKYILLLLSILIMSEAIFPEDSDTTYGEVRVKKRTSSSGSSGDTGSDDEDDDWSSCTNECMSSCFSFLLDGCINILCNSNDHMGITITDSKDESESTHPSSVGVPEKQITWPWESPTPVHFSGGLVLGGETYTDSIADAFDIGADIGVTVYPTTFLGIRFSTELLAGIGRVNVDLVTDVFVNDSLIGTRVFTDTKLYNRIIPLRTELLWIFPAAETPVSISTGGGISYKQEKITGQERFNGTTRNRTVIFEQWSPTLHFGIGIYSQLGDVFLIPEFMYSLMFNDDMYDYQAPGDVAPHTHMFRFRVSICNP